MKHQLSLEIPDTNNSTLIRILDTSLYVAELPVICGVVQITSPGFIVPVQIKVDTNFNLILDACDLGISLLGCADAAPDLPDGIYTVNYSVSPNDKVYVEYNYLRITKLMNEYIRELGKLELASCEPGYEIKVKLQELRLIKSLIEAAKAKVEYLNSAHQGMELYKYAQKRLHKFSGICLTC